MKSRFEFPRCLGINPPAWRRASYLLSTVLLLQNGCAANTPMQAAKAKTDPYYQDAQLCRAKNPAKGLAANVDPASAVNSDGYLKCLNGMGYKQDAKTDPLLVAIRKCQSQGTTSVSVSGAKTAQPPTPAAFRLCLKQRGFPSAGQPPAGAVIAGATAVPVGSARAPETDASAPASTPSKKGKSKKSGTASGNDPKDRVQTVYIPRRKPAAQ
jgi:hypothetical protein